MSEQDSGKKSAPSASQPQAKESSSPQFVPKEGAASEAAQSIARTLKAWRAVSGGSAKASAIPKGAGQSIPQEVRQRMEPHLGASLAGARLHTGGDSASAARGMGARAFTVGDDVHFGAGEYNPGTQDGDRLLAHELTHVVQGRQSGVQRKAEEAGDAKAGPEAKGGDEKGGKEGGGGGEEGGVEVSSPDEAPEKEADAKADEAVEGLHGGGAQDKKQKGEKGEKGEKGAHAKGEGGDAKGGDAKGGDAEAKGDGGDAKGGDGGDAKGGDAKAEGGAKEAPGKGISAKLSGVGLKVFRVGGATPAATGAAATPPADPLADFRKALASGSRGQVVIGWDKVPDAAKSKVTQGDIEKCFDVSPGTAFGLMKGAGVDFQSAPTLVKKFLAIPDPSSWSLQLSPYFASFLTGLPDANTVTKAELTALSGFVGSISHGREVFEKVYPKLQDTTYDAKILKSTAWTTSTRSRLFDALQQAPTAHVQASSGGFFLGTHEHLDADQKKPWNPLGFAWQDGTKMVLPLSSGGADGGGTGHDMTGGTGSGVAPGKGEKAQTHFQGSVTHEVGHAVSNQVGGDAFATTFCDFAPSNPDSFGKALWDDGAVQASTDGFVKSGQLKKADAIPAVDMRGYLAGGFPGGAGPMPKGFKQAQVDAFIPYVSGQPLVQYWWSVVKNGQNDYQIPGTNIVGGKAYAFLSRFNNQLATYKEQIFTDKVSWYSVSSPAEWFAENYSHYYRMEGKHPIAAVKTYFDGLDKFKWDPAANGAQGGLHAGGGAQAGAEGGGAEGGAQGGGAQGGGAQGGGAQGGAQGGGGQGGGGGAANRNQSSDETAAQNGPPPNIRRMEFPW